MKKFFAALLAAVMVLALAACGQTNQPPAGGNNAGTPPSDEQTTPPAGENGGEDIADALTLLNTIWAAYGEDEKFAASGGDFSEENMTTDAPGKYGITDTAALDSSLGFPADSAALIDDAASLTHMMNANTFTCGAFHVTSAGDVSALAEALRGNIQQRQWMCGFPDKLLIVSVGQYLISAFGNEELIDNFLAKTQGAYASAEVLYNEAIL